MGDRTELFAFGDRPQPRPPRPPRTPRTPRQPHRRRRVVVGLVALAAVAAETSMVASRVTAATSPFDYDCAPTEVQCVTNFNRNIGNLRGTKSVDIVRVTLGDRDTPSMGEIKSDIRQLDNFFDTASRGQLHLRIDRERTVDVDTHNCSKAKNDAIARADGNAFLTVYQLPRGLCDYSNAGNHRIFLNGGLFRDYAHESGHVLGLGHGNRNVNGDFDPYGDASTYMGSSPSLNYNLPQLHWLGWTDKGDLVKVNNAVDNGSSMEVTLRPVDRNVATDNANPLGAVYEMPGTDSRLFVAVPYSHDSGVNGIGGGEIFVYRAPKCQGCTGMSMGTTVVGRFGPSTDKAHDVWGITITPVRVDKQRIWSSGRWDDKFASITVRIAKSPS